MTVKIYIIIQIEDKFNNRCELIKHNLGMDINKKNQEENNGKLIVPIVPKAKKSNIIIHKNIFKENDLKLDRKFSARNNFDLMLKSPVRKISKDPSLAIREEFLSKKIYEICERISISYLIFIFRSKF